MLVTFVCQYCKVEITRKKTGSDKMLYCNTSCSNKSRIRHKVPKELCLCGGVKHSTAKMCMKCTKVKRRLTSLQDIRNTCSINDYHSRIRNYAREDFDGERSCQACGYSLMVDICHIRAVKDFPMTATLAEVNSIDNLVALCKNHHWEFDNGYLRLEDNEVQSSFSKPGD